MQFGQWFLNWVEFNGILINFVMLAHSATGQYFWIIKRCGIVNPGFFPTYLLTWWGGGQQNFLFVYYLLVYYLALDTQLRLLWKNELGKLCQLLVAVPFLQMSEQLQWCHFLKPLFLQFLHLVVFVKLHYFIFEFCLLRRGWLTIQRTVFSWQRFDKCLLLHLVVVENWFKLKTICASAAITLDSWFAPISKLPVVLRLN